MSRRALQYAAVIAILIYFFAFTYRGLGAGISNDDVMNIQFLHGWGTRPFASLLGHALLVATPVYRPMGGLVYRTLFAAFGLDPLPYRIFCFALMVVNLGLAARFVRLLSGSHSAALFATLLSAFHTCMAQLYFESATLYDLLCFTFGVAALIVYIGRRQTGAAVTGRSLLVFLALFALALDSKEMAITWPGILLLYEVIFHSHHERLGVRWIAPGLAGALALVYGVVKTKTPNLLSTNTNYTPRFDPPFVLEQMRHYYSLLLWDAPVSITAMLVCLVALLALAAVLRSRPMLLGWFFAAVTLLPASVIPGRGGFVWYIPYLGWALYLGSAVELLSQRLSRRMPARFPQAAGPIYLRGLYLRGGLFLLIGAALVSIQLVPSRTFSVPLDNEEQRIRLLLQAVKRGHPTLPPASRILIAEDTFETVDWRPLFLLRLAYGDPSIWVDRPSQMEGAFDPNDISIYDTVIYARRQPYRIVDPVKDAVPFPVHVELSPRAPHRGGELRVTAADFANCAIDVEYRLVDGVLNRFGLVRNWCTLDGEGKCTIPLPPNAEVGHVELRHIRFCRREWHPVDGAFEIRP